ncbi:MAG TPA: diguanylate cyclase [Terriglobia bacterium]|nr:diguanylate cyclase [Terriglobia bacterium]
MRFGRYPIKMRSEVAIWAAIFSMMLTLALTWISVVNVTSYIERESHEDMAIIVNDYGQAFDHRMSQNFRMVEMAAAFDVLRLPDSPLAAKRTVLANLQMVVPDCVWAGIIGTDGIVQISGDGRGEGQDVSRETWFTGGLRQALTGSLRQPLLSNPRGRPITPGHLMVNDDRRVIDFARPLRDPLGNVIGVLNVAISAKVAVEFREMLLNNRTATLGIDVIVTDAAGHVLLGPAGLMGQTLSFAAGNPAEQAAGSPAGRPGYGKEAMTSAMHVYIPRWPDGGDYISAVGTGTGYQDFPGLHWNVVVRQPRDIAYAPAYRMRTRLIVVGVVLAIIFAGVGWLVADRITDSIRRLTHHALRLEKGERGTSFPTGNGNAEVVVLGETLDHLVSALLQREQELLDLNANLEQRIADRTALLAASNRHLESEMAQRQAVEKEREMLIGQLRDQAEHDPLTGTLNRRAFITMAERDSRRLRRENGHFAAIMVDIDHFKRVNDSYGHSVGDEVIKGIAAMARQTLRDSDLLCRYGGEEFAILIADPGADNAVAVAERLRQNIAALRFPVPAPEDEAAAAQPPGAPSPEEAGFFQVTISLGVAICAVLDLPDGSVETLLQRADEALYIAKRSGRNRTAIGDHLVDGSDSEPGRPDRTPPQAVSRG